MVDFKMGMKEQRLILKLISIVGVFTLIPFTRNFIVDNFLNIGVSAMPNFLSVGMGLGVVLAILVYRLHKNII